MLNKTKNFSCTVGTEAYIRISYHMKKESDTVKNSVSSANLARPRDVDAP